MLVKGCNVYSKFQLCEVKLTRAKDMCVNTQRSFGLAVSDLPKFLAGSDVTDGMHALTLVDPDRASQTVTILLALRGVT